MLTYGQWSPLLTYTDRTVTTVIDGNDFRTDFFDERYTVLRCILPVSGIQEKHFYRIHLQQEAENLSYKLLYIWYGENGEEIEKGYVHPGGRFLALPGSARLEIELLIFGKGPGHFSLQDLRVKDDGLYVPRLVRVCAISYAGLDTVLTPRPLAENVDYILNQIDAIAHLKPDLVVLTENVFQTNLDIRTPIRLDDPLVGRLCKKAAEHGTYIVCSLLEEDSEKIIHNTGILIDRRGAIQGTHRKTHLTVSEIENGLPLGETLEVFDTDFGKLGIQICWEHFFPEPVRALALKGAELIAVPTHGFQTFRAAARAQENGVHLATAYTWKKGTMIFDPAGQVLSTADETGYAFTEVDLNAPVLMPWLSCHSNGSPRGYYLNERRPDLCGTLL